MKYRFLFAVLLFSALSIFLVSCDKSAVIKVGLVQGYFLDCPDTPNCVNSQVYPDDEAFVEPIAVSGMTPQKFEQVVDTLDAMSRTELQALKANYAHITYLTAISRFIDDVEIYWDGKSDQIHIRSASRVGYTDLGTNRRRVEAIRKEIQEKLAQ